ncbi:ribosomal protein L16 [Sporothrix schenckii ATCC 58251]|uniref:Ribosomal protein L16 n=2 Tax=Sporothrix schenckii TaxID=29908 RepID=U7PLA9_SPOS1|nr:ribosomal protein L16 [Sporothrix schenckii ATCC 58251]
MPTSMPGAAMLRQAFQRFSITASPSTASSTSYNTSSSAVAPRRLTRTFSARPAMASSSIRPAIAARTPSSFLQHHMRRPFSATAAVQGTWLEPQLDRRKRMMKGRPRVATGGSAKGTTVVWGDYGLRMYDHHRRISAKQLKVAEDTIKQRLRGQKYRLYKRVNCNVGVFVSGNEMRMGKGKGSFDHWAARVAVNRVVFELRGAIHEQVARDAFRLAGNKLPGQYEFVKKGDAPVVGITKMENGLTLEDLKRPWKAAADVPAVEEASSGPAASAPPA